MVAGQSKGNEKFYVKVWHQRATIIALVSLSISILIFVDDYLLPTRADLKIIVDPYEAIWGSGSDRATLSVNGSLYNPSTVAAKIVEYKLSAVYNLPNDDQLVLSVTYKNISRTWNIPNDMIGESRDMHFHLRMHIYQEFFLDELTGEMIAIRENKPDEFRIAVTYDDGLSLQTKERTFTLSS